MDVLRADHSGLSGKCSQGGVTVVTVETGGSERYVLEAFEGCKPRALFVVARPAKNSLAAALEALAALPKGGLFLVKDEREEEMVLSMAKRLERFVGARIALIGGKAPWLVAPGYGEEDFEQLLGSEVVPISKREVTEAFEEVKAEETTDVVRSVKVGASEVLVREEDLVRAAKLHIALGRILKGFKAAAINCFQILREVSVTPCLSLSLFNAANFPFACEGDLNSLLGMILTYVAFGRVGGMFNLDYIEGKKALLAHCTAPLTLVDKYALSYHYETGYPLAIRGWVESGKDSLVFRLDKSGYEVLRGKVVEGPRMDACETQVWLELESPPKALGNHRIWVDTSEKDRLEQLIRALGLHKA